MIRVKHEEKFYNFNELSKEAQEKAIEEYMKEPGNSIEAFAEAASSEIINDTLNDLGYDYSVKHIEFDLGHYVHFDGGLHQEELMKVGERLLDEKDIKTLKELEDVTTFIGVIEDKNVHITDGLRFVQNLPDEKYNEYFNALQNLTEAIEKDVVSIREDLIENISELLYDEQFQEEMKGIIREELEDHEYLYTESGVRPEYKTLADVFKVAEQKQKNILSAEKNHTTKEHGEPDR